MRKRYSYKPTGIEWIGDIPDHWESLRLKYLVTCNDEVLNDSTPPETEIKYVEISDVEKGKGIVNFSTYNFKQAPSRARRKVMDGDIIVSTVRTYLKAVATVINPDPSLVVSTGFAVLRPRCILSEYLGFLFESRLIDEVVRRSTGVSYPAINSTDLVEIPVPSPTPDEQRFISLYLRKKTKQIDETIQKKLRLIELLREERTSFINQMIVQGFDENVKMKPSGVEWLGDVPENWEVKRLSHVASMLTGYAFQSENFSLEYGTKLVRGDNITEGYLRWGEKTRYWQEKDEILERFYLNEHDVLIGMDGSKVGKNYAMVAQEDLPLLLVQRVARIRSNNVLLQEWIYFWVGSLFFRQYVDIVRTDPAIPHITLKDIKDFPITLPPISALKDLLWKLKTTVERIGTTISICESEINLIQEYRSALINEVVTGKVCVV